MTLDESLRDAVATATAPLVAKVDRLCSLMERQLSPALGGVEDAARVMGCSVSTVRRMVRGGEIAHRRAGKRIVVDLASLKPAAEQGRGRR